MSLTNENKVTLAKVGIFESDDWKMSIIHLSRTVIKLMDKIEVLENGSKKESSGQKESTG